MNSLIALIEENINNSIEQYISLVSEKFNIDKSELKNIWETQICDDKEKPRGENLEVNTKKVSSKATSKASSKVSSRASTPKSTTSGYTNKCIYKFIKGKQQGEICNKSTKNSYCAKHAKFEESGQVEKKNSLPKIEKKSTDRIIRLNKEINKWWHMESKLVFKSSKEKVVIGKYDNDIFRDICKDDIKDCEKYGFKYEIKDEEEDKEEEKEEEKKKETKRIEIPIKKIENKKIELPIASVQKKKNIIEEINLKAQNVEDVIKDMLEENNDSDNDSSGEEEEEEELLEEEM